MKKQKSQSVLLRIAVYSGAALTAGVLLLVVGYILVKGIPHLNRELFAPRYTSENGSVVPALVNTFSLTLLALLIAVPLGIFSAVYLTEYARRESRLVGVIRTTAETLAGIPSIIYGLFGYMLFVVRLRWGYCLLAGALTVAVMILPVIMRTTQEALNAVPETYREGSFGLGAGKLRTVFCIAIPAAMPGILSGVILSVGRIVGETAALIYTAGTVAQISAGVKSSGRTLSVHLYALWNEGLAQDKAYATAVVLLFATLVINGVSSLIAGRLTKGDGNG